MKDLAITIALEILEMHAKIKSQEKELERLHDIEERYLRLLDESIRHGEAMMGNMLNILTAPGVVEALEKNQEDND